ncbi:transaldolase family protein [Inquilinus sp. CAU 1745]|uniref:transaldolase family protein n=1 Tax=Inquilinus sp. CAU 1745 TaxID=3140369 RepID=UPI00325AB3D5
MTPAAMPTGLRLFLDSADVEAWRRWLPLGIFCGVTTNPTLLQRAEVPCTPDALRRLADQAFALDAPEVQMQVWGEDAASMVAAGTLLAAFDERVVVKVPVTREGLICARELANEGTGVTLTALYAPHQALLAAAAGARYAAPYLGRMNDAGRQGEEDIARMEEMLARTGSETRLLVASLRSVDDLVRLAVRGIDTFTISAAVADALLVEPLTDKAVADFEAHARAMGATTPP